MQSSCYVVLATFFATSTLAKPMTPSFFVKRNEVKCGITGDAPLNDCMAMVNADSIWDAEFHETDAATCTFTNPFDNNYAYPAYSQCLAYGQGVQMPSNQVHRDLAKEILGCGSTENSVNGQTRYGLGKVCMSNREGCGDCFDDAGES